MADWIETFLYVTEGIPSPRRFRLWAAISTIAGALERRVYTLTRGGHTHPNLFVSLAGQSGHGKTQSIMLARNLWAGVAELKMAPDDVTNASFYDALAGCVRSTMNGAGMTIFSAMSVCARELGNFMPKYDTGFMSNLSDIYDNPPHFSSARRTSVSVNIDKPTVNILAAVTPDYLGDLLPEVAWGQGFTSRMIFIYDHLDADTDIDVFKQAVNVGTTSLRPELNEFFELSGEFIWAENARVELNAWVNAGAPPKPTHGRLKQYNTRRTIHVLKLSMISAVSAGRDLYVTLEDFERALEWLLDAETVMPDVFRAMGQKSDNQLIEDLQYHIYTVYSGMLRDGRKPIPVAEVWKFLGPRIESHRIDSIIKLAVQSGRLVKDKYDDAYTPGPLDGAVEL